MKYTNFIMAIFGLLIISPIVNALGIIQEVDDFSDINNRVITLTTKERYASHTIRIPNNDDIAKTIKFTLKSGKEVVTIRDLKDEYTIPPKTKLELTFDINIPEDTEPGQEWKVSFEVLELKSGEGSESTGAMLTQQVTDDFTVRLEKAPTNYKWLIYVGIAVLLLIIIIGVALKRSGGGYY